MIGRGFEQRADALRKIGGKPKPSIKRVAKHRGDRSNGSAHQLFSRRGPPVSGLDFKW